jgi:hypothetical protein
MIKILYTFKIRKMSDYVPPIDPFSKLISYCISHKDEHISTLSRFSFYHSPSLDVFILADCDES